MCRSLPKSFRRRVFAISVVTFVLLSGNHGTADDTSDPHTISFDDYYNIGSVGSPEISPNGQSVAYTHKSQIWLIPFSGGEPVAVTTKGSSAWAPSWSRDGKSLAFLSDRDGDVAQVYLLKLDEFGEAQQKTSIEGGVRAINWPTDRTKLLAVTRTNGSASPSDEKDRKTDGDQPWVIDRLDFKVDRGGGYITGQSRRHLFVHNLADDSKLQITSGDFDESDPCWSPDGKTIAFVSNRSPDPDRDYNMDIWIVSATNTDKGQTLRQLTTNSGPDRSPKWSPDGKWIAYITASDAVYATEHLAIVPAGGGSPKILTKELDRNVSPFAFSNDSQSIYFLFNNAGGRHLGKISVDGGLVERVIEGPRNVSDFSLADNGLLVAKIAEGTGVGEVYSYENDELKCLTHLHDKALSKLQLGTVEKIQFPSNDGTPIEAFVVKPPGFNSKLRYPTLLNIHGGPVAQFSYGYSFTPQYFAAHGYLVVEPNPRGSTGHGDAFRRAIYRSWGEKDYEDVIAAVDRVIELGYADPDRLGVMGYSYGGYMTNVVITRTARFKGAVSGAGHTLIVANYGHDQYQKWYEWELGPPWKNRPLWESLSPFSRVQSVKTPTLIMCGKLDWNVPVLNSEILYQSLKRLGVETQLVVYPNSHHGGWSRAFQKDYYKRSLQWMDRNVKGVPAATTANSARSPTPAPEKRN